MMCSPACPGFFCTAPVPYLLRLVVPLLGLRLALEVEAVGLVVLHLLQLRRDRLGLRDDLVLPRGLLPRLLLVVADLRQQLVAVRGQGVLLLLVLVARALELAALPVEQRLQC